MIPQTPIANPPSSSAQLPNLSVHIVSMINAEHPVLIREMSSSDYDGVVGLWQNMAGIGLSSADDREPIGRYLQRNPGCSFVAIVADSLIGAVLCGHDGRRGFIHHLAVSPYYRRRGIGRQLVNHCLSALRANGIEKCHIFVYATNQTALAFWQTLGWSERFELVIMSLPLGEVLL